MITVFFPNAFKKDYSKLILGHPDVLDALNPQPTGIWTSSVSLETLEGWLNECGFAF